MRDVFLSINANLGYLVSQLPGVVLPRECVPVFIESFARDMGKELVIVKDGCV